MLNGFETDDTKECPTGRDKYVCQRAVRPNSSRRTDLDLWREVGGGEKRKKGKGSRLGFEFEWWGLDQDPSPTQIATLFSGLRLNLREILGRMRRCYQ